MAAHKVGVNGDNSRDADRLRVFNQAGGVRSSECLKNCLHRKERKLVNNIVILRELLLCKPHGYAGGWCSSHKS